MENVGWEGVLYLYLGFLWPPVATSLIYLLRRKVILNESIYWTVGILGGYAAAILVPFALWLAVALGEVAGAWKTADLLPEPGFWLFYSFLAPVVWSHFAATKRG